MPEISYEKKKLGVALGLGGTVIGAFLVLFFALYMASCTNSCEPLKYMYEISMGFSIILVSQFVMSRR